MQEHTVNKIYLYNKNKIAFKFTKYNTLINVVRLKNNYMNEKCVFTFDIRTYTLKKPHYRFKNTIQLHINILQTRIQIQTKKTDISSLYWQKALSQKSLF